MHYYLIYILKALNCHYMSINSISVSLIIRLWNLWIFLLNIQCICPLNLSCLLILVPWITMNMFNVHGLSILLSIKSCLFIVLVFDIIILSIIFLLIWSVIPRPQIYFFDSKKKKKQKHHLHMNMTYILPLKFKTICWPRKYLHWKNFFPGTTFKLRAVHIIIMTSVTNN